MDLNHLLDREATQVSGGELQRFSIAAVCLKKPDIYVFNKPSNFLDVRQRLKAAEVISSLLKHDNVLDYLSDFVCCLYGKPTAYGVVTLPFSVREGINVFLSGFFPSENLCFRDESLTFKVSDKPQESEGKVKSYARYKYPNMSKKLGNFKLGVMEGEFTASQICYMLGENGTGKTIFIRMLICDAMDLNHLLDREATQVSGGELQRFSIAAVCLKKPDIYVFNKPSNFLDVRQRLRAAEVICSLLKHDKFGSIISLPTAYGVVTLPFSVREGINVFLAGFVPTENFRFRDESLTFKVSDKTQESEGKVKSYARYKYPNMSKKLGNFKLDVMEGEFTASQIIVMLGENGTGKTIFIRTLVTSGQGSTS
ncbi:hypothetical protein F2Q69_00052788 [Brassica cretica]|uniref:ABC transporter domain-containing protein n=1 Tax=Brassica cretica TaxID=69181 RepID=A0A8S9N1G6_BRACR|nr:hypothetical protein F2Q69_00052788 [Brassica cretica]